ncbi:FAD-NAD(P)-binding [Sulfitobacter pontiacus]|uniref:FAD-NAD(P)-binding n=1 Tax=Sulfitobacter pontiacus TaxID=60137 RepID=A0A1H3DJP0_9RHOB|nr:FAD/NAD(P)-binding domain-containing protein [Sulfitobacter pontiacus]SDX66577.1 FAD-NAD(P)-binding [Sulfitobacter pontiacus]
MRDTEIAIVGCGPKGLYALDSLCEAARRSAEHRFTVHIFEPSAHPGAGPIYDPRQPEVLLMNFPAGLINAWTGGRGPSFLEWAARSPKPVDAGDYVPRAHVGRYLFWSFERIVAQAPSNVRLIQHKTRVDAVKCEGDRWSISAQNISVDHVLITTGHQDGFRQSAPETRNHIPSPFPIDQRLTQTAVPPASTVRCKGFALTFIDTMLALTEGRGGVFALSATGYTYTPSGTESRRIAPFSRSGRPMRAKVEAALFTQPQGDAFWDDQRAELSHILRTPYATFTNHIWPAFLSFADQVLGNPSGTSANFFTHRTKTTFTPDEIRQDLRIGYDIAMGHRAQDSAWALAEVWRRCYSQLINWISHRELTPDDAHHFRQIAAEMERLAFGPPAQNIGKLITLEQAGIVSFDHMTGEATADVTINATIPPAGGAELAAPLDGLLRDGHLSIGAMGGVRVDKEAHALTRDGIAKGLSIIGRATEGCVLGNDTLSRSLHDLPENWAAAVVQSARQSNALEHSL